ncbi:MAG: MFS transporter [Lachnospiraceae bacterium]|nr:MFS transporter [Lachnospiraceae bacterium]MBR0305330.1 MFS transporter [Lachnospiraceae bacterium]
MTYKKRFFAYFAVMVLFNMAASFAHPVTPTIIQDQNMHDYMFGVALGVMLITNFLMSPFWGKINVYISSRSTFLIGCLGYAVAQLWFAYSTTELMVILARMFAGLFTGGIYVSFLTYIVNVANPEDQAKYLTYNATIQSVGSAFGYMIGGFLGEYSVRGTFLIQVACILISGIAFYFICVPDAVPGLKINGKQLAKEVNPFQAFMDCRLFMSVAFAMLFAVNILINFANTGFDQAFNYYLKDQLGLTSSYNGIIKAAVGFVSFVSNMTICVWIINKTDTKKSMTVLVAICAAAALGITVFENMAIFMVLGVLVYAGYSVSLPVIQNMVAAQADPAQKNLVMGFYNATKSLGSIAGSFIAGGIYAVNAKLPFGITFVIYAVGVVAAFGYMMYAKKER